MNPIPIFIPIYESASSSGKDPGIVGFSLFVMLMLLACQYIWWAILVYEQEFYDKLEALLWLIPGWPVVRFLFIIIRNFWSL